MSNGTMGWVGRWALTAGVGLGLAVGCSNGQVGSAPRGAGVNLHGGSRVDDGPFEWPFDGTLTATSAGPTSVSLSWPAAMGTGGVAHYAVYKDGSLVATVSGMTLTNVVTGLTTGTSYTFTVQAVDGGGVATSDGPTTTYVAVTPSATFVASPIDRTVGTTLAGATSFLYTGSDPIQTGVSSGTIVPSQASVIRGHLMAQDGSPLVGAHVSIVNHPEFGSTLTQADGEYDLAVNGGQSLRLHYTLADYLPADRVVQAPWQDYVTASDVTLVQLDSQVTAIDVSSSSSTMQIAQGSPSTDSSGTRQATLFVPPGTEATMTLADGSTSPLTTMSVRATEYSVGDTSNTALPADLPPTSAFAYAVELTADEALAAGATKLTFSQPLALYVEDFLSLPAGTSVPSGYYDPSKGAWVASSNGNILQIVSVTDGAADLDVDGDGLADTGAPLDALGITDLERQQVASLYSVGQALWRTPIAHFTSFGDGPNDGGPSDTPDSPTPCITGAEEIPCPESGPAAGGYDSTFCGEDEQTYVGFTGGACSYYCCPPGSTMSTLTTCTTSPCDSPPPPPPPPDGPGDCNKEHASTIGCQRQSLGEDLPIAGTPYSLHYQSDWQRGYLPEVNVPLSVVMGGSPTGIELRVSVAGRLFTQTFSAGGGQSTTFTWDGRDGYGRLLQGSQPIAIQLGYDYSGVYQNAAGFGVQGNGSPIAGSTTRLPFTLTKGWVSTIESWDAQPEGFGGWTLNIHHTYDVTGRILRLGDGNNRTLRNVPSIIQTFAGNGVSGTSGDGGAATAASVTSPQSVAVGADGSVYITDGQSCIRRVGPDGIIHTFAGECGSPGFSGDGGAATSAQLAAPQDIALGADGSLYIADTTNQRIRRVDTGGVIQTVAGSGPTGATSGTFSGDGGQATLATLDNPSGVDVTSDGTIYIADRDNARIRQVSPAGIIVTIAGSGTSSTSTGTGGAATTAGLASPVKVRVGPDGSIYIAETTGNVVRRVGPEGIIHPVVGTGVAGYTRDGYAANTATLNAPMDVAFGHDGSLYVVDQNDVVRQVTPGGILTTITGLNGHTTFSGDNGLATAATLGTSHGLRVGPDGSVYIASSADNRVRRIRPAFDGFSSTAGSFRFPSDDGRQVFVFDGSGRHLQTLDALTGATLYTFAYDGSGRLSGVTDVDGNVTQFNHSGPGSVTTIVGPYGQTYSFTADTNGYLASATDPASQTTQFTYDGNGLLQTKLDASGGLAQYTYDADGRLILDQDAAGGSTTLSRSDSSTGSQVTLTSAMGLQTTLGTNAPSFGTPSRINTMPSGAQSTMTPGPTSTTVVQPSGVQIVETQTPDPRPGFGMLSPVSSVTTTLPSGLSSTQTTTRSATYSGGTLATFTEQNNLNGNTWTRLFTAATRTWTTTSPVGRTSTMTIDAAGRPTSISIPGLTSTSITYDTHGRLVSSTQGSRTWTTTYDVNGYPASWTDPLSEVTSFTNDPIGRPTTTVLPDSRAVGTSYDPSGSVTQVVLPSTASHAFSFTPVELVSSYTPPTIGSGTWSTGYSYDLDRKLTTVTRPDGATIGYGYDSTGLLQSITYPQGTLTTYADDITGLVSGATSATGESTSFTYDGTLLTGTTWSGPVAGALTFGFDSNFRMTSQALNGDPLPFAYDADGLMTGAGSLTMTLDSANGRVAGTTLGSMTDSYAYDANGLLSSYTAKYSGTTLYSESVVRDAVGRITQKTEIVQGTTHVWGYTFDSSGRLTDVTEDGSFFSHYGYDADDNRTTYTNVSGTVSPTYDAQDRLVTCGAASYTHTTNGELTGKTDGTGTTSYTYDALGNLLDVTPPSGTPIDYVIDGENRRVGKEVGGSLTTGFLYQDSLRTVAQLDASGNVVSRFVFGTKPNVPDYFTTSTGTFQIVSDHLGSPRAGAGRPLPGRRWLAVGLLGGPLPNAGTKATQISAMRWW